jgi:hypothetical protein
MATRKRATPGGAVSTLVLRLSKNLSWLVEGRTFAHRRHCRFADSICVAALLEMRSDR